MKILLHSSKTMKPEKLFVHKLTEPLFMQQAAYLHGVLQAMDVDQLARLMKINEVLAQNVKAQLVTWNDASLPTAAALTFRGDIYSGLSAVKWSDRDATFAQGHLLILSGLYGLLRPFDAIMPYRLEMGYKLDLPDGERLSHYWESQLAHALSPTDTYVNLTAKEYYTVIEKQLAEATVISPKFLTMSKKTNKPVFVTVHAKIARGSFASWLITHRIDDAKAIPSYNLLNYVYEKQLSTPVEPVFVCQEFGGIGMSVRLK